MMHCHLQEDIRAGLPLDRERVARHKQDWVYALKAPINTIGALYSVAKQTGLLWLLIEKLIKGEVVNQKKFKIPKSVVHFNAMAGVAPPLLTMWLSKVQQSSMTLREFKEKCLRFKAASRLKTELVAHLVIKHQLEVSPTLAKFVADPTWTKKVLGQRILDYGKPTWKDAQRGFPLVATNQFVEAWIKTVVDLPVRHGIPNVFKQQIDERVSRALIEKKLAVRHCFVCVMLLFFHQLTFACRRKTPTSSSSTSKTTSCYCTAATDGRCVAPFRRLPTVTSCVCCAFVLFLSHRMRACGACLDHCLTVAVLIITIYPLVFLHIVQS
jgi:hypothetical protein